MTQREDKKALFANDKKQGNIWLVAASATVILLALGGWLFAGGSKGGASAGSSAPLVDGQVSIPVAQISDGKAHFFTYQGGGSRIGYFVVKSGDGKLRTAFDTCDVCYKAKKGYRQEGESMICNNCDQKFETAKIGDVAGGCNPAPLAATLAGDRLVIAAADLEKGAWYFK